MFTFNTLKTENFKKKELNKQHINNTFQTFCVFLWSFYCLRVWRRGAEVRKNCFKTGRVNSFYCALGVRGSSFRSSLDWWNSSSSTGVLPLQWIPAGKASLLSLSHRGVLEHLSLSTTLHLRWAFWIGGGEFWTFYCFFFVAALIEQFYVTKR